MLQITEEQQIVIDNLAEVLTEAYNIGLSIEFNPETGELIALNTSDLQDTENVTWSPDEHIEHLKNQGYVEVEDYYSESVSVFSCNQAYDADAELMILKN